MAETHPTSRRPINDRIDQVVPLATTRFPAAQIKV